MSLLLPSIAMADEPMVQIEGTASQSLRDTILSVLGPVDAAPRSMAQARRRAKEAAAQAESVLRSQGYYSADVIATVRERDTTKKSDKRNAPTPTLTINSGPQFLFSEISVKYADTSPSIAEDIRRAIVLKPQDAAIAANVVAAELRAVNLLRSKGYPEAKALPREAVVDHATQTMRVTYRISAGPLTRFGEIEQSGTAYIAKTWPKMVAPFEAGEIFDDRKLNRLSSRVIGTGAFDSASATLGDTVTKNEDGTVTRNVFLNVDQGAINTISGEVGYSTTDGSGIDVIYERRNFIGYAQTLRLIGTAKTNEISAAVAYNIPFAWRVDRELDLGASVSREDTDAFTGERARANALMTQKLSRKFKVSLGAAFEASQYEEEGVEVRSLLFDGLLKANYDSRNSIFDPETGFLILADVTPTYNFGDDDGFFTNAEVSGATYKRVSDNFVLAGRLKAGTIFGADQTSVPLNRRYYGGGGGSVRGFGYQSISPTNANGDLIGGRSLAEGSVEVRYRGSGKLGFVGFVDAGSVTRSDLPSFGDVRYGAGVGVRYYTSFAPLRADIAIPINKRDSDNSVQVYISIGQAF
ncbi:autotransporter assembly complex family protein [Litorimonas sp. RW-G-Af-16]